MPGIIVDIGCGDGGFAYELARKYPDRMIIGIDPNHKGLIEVSGKIIRKPAKGGVKNALFVFANIADLPNELTGVANQVFINFPWGSLLEDIVLGREEAWNNIKKICQNQALIDILLGYEKKIETKKIGRLPALNIEYFKNDLGPKLKRIGFKLIKTQPLNASFLRKYPSKWAKKLSFAKARNFYFLRFKLQK
jgi:16S rRNA (adenine(1408)-N(1))-methyltransferase